VSIVLTAFFIGFGGDFGLQFLDFWGGCGYFIA
jgi:hypothetical protein